MKKQQVVINNIVSWDLKDINDKIINNIYVDNVIYDSFLKISLKSDTHNIVFTFQRFISFRLSDESYLLEYWDTLKDNNKNLMFSKIINSSYFKEMSILSKKFVVDGGPDMIEHFAIFTENECLEIISDLSPLIEVYEIDINIKD